MKKREKIRLEDGIYRVNLYRLNENAKKDNLLKRCPFISNDSLYIKHDISSEGIYSHFLTDSQILVKFDREKDRVVELITGLEIPIVCFYSNSLTNEDSKVYARGFKKNEMPIICVGINYKNYKHPMVSFDKTFSYAKQYDLIVNEESFESETTCTNLLEFSSEVVDEMIEEYNRVYSSEEDLREKILSPVNEFETKRQLEIKIAQEKRLQKLREEEKQKEDTKRNYEKYYYVDGNTEKRGIKRLFRK